MTEPTITPEEFRDLAQMIAKAGGADKLRRRLRRFAAEDAESEPEPEPVRRPVRLRDREDGAAWAPQSTSTAPTIDHVIALHAAGIIDGKRARDLVAELTQPSSGLRVHLDGHRAPEQPSRSVQLGRLGLTVLGVVGTAFGAVMALGALSLALMWWLISSQGMSASHAFALASVAFGGLATLSLVLVTRAIRLRDEEE